MLAADGFVSFFPVSPIEHAYTDSPENVDGPLHWNGGRGAGGQQSRGLADRDDEPMLVYLDEIAEEVGELFEIEEPDNWWLEGA
jgi:hypothetical protein